MEAKRRSLAGLFAVVAWTEQQQHPNPDAVMMSGDVVSSAPLHEEYHAHYAATTRDEDYSQRSMGRDFLVIVTASDD